MCSSASFQSMLLSICKSIRQGYQAAACLEYKTTWCRGFGLYAALAVVVSVRGLIRSSRHGSDVTPEQYDVLSRMFNVVTAVIASTSLLVAIFFWAALYSPGDEVCHCFAAADAQRLGHLPQAAPGSVSQLKVLRQSHMLLNIWHS